MEFLRFVLIQHIFLLLLSSLLVLDANTHTRTHTHIHSNAHIADIYLYIVIIMEHNDSLSEKSRYCIIFASNYHVSYKYFPNLNDKFFNYIDGNPFVPHHNDCWTSINVFTKCKHSPSRTFFVVALLSPAGVWFLSTE